MPALVSSHGRNSKRRSDVPKIKRCPAVCGQAGRPHIGGGLGEERNRRAGGHDSAIGTGTASTDIEGNGLRCWKRDERGKPRPARAVLIAKPYGAAHYSALHDRCWIPSAARTRGTSISRLFISQSPPLNTPRRRKTTHISPTRRPSVASRLFVCPLRARCKHPRSGTGGVESIGRARRHIRSEPWLRGVPGAGWGLGWRLGREELHTCICVLTDPRVLEGLSGAEAEALSGEIP